MCIPFPEPRETERDLRASLFTFRDFRSGLDTAALYGDTEDIKTRENRGKELYNE